jgi:MFS family permease
MVGQTGEQGQRRSGGFMLAYALANAGGVLAYLPFLTLLLPLKVEALAGEGRVAALSQVLIGGAVAASIGNILAGMLVDRSYAHGGGRRLWIAAGLLGMAGGYGLVLAAQAALALLLAVVAFQLLTNIMLSPLTVMMVDEVPDAQKGLAGGLLALGQPLSMLAGVALVSMYEAGEGTAYVAICLGVAALMLPLLWSRPIATTPGEAGDRGTMARRDLVWVGCSRLLLLTANSLLAGVLVYYFESLSGPISPGTVARRVGLINLLACGAAVPVAVLVGALPASVRRRKGFVLVSGLIAGVALAVMGLARGWQMAALGYGLFVCAVQVYSSQHSAIVAQALRSARHRARDLGLQNLANTVPAIIGPGLVLMLYTGTDLHALIWVMLALVLGSAAALALARVR